ncbi:dihydropyrimidinase [Acidisoma silvae]|uniref:D-hydantoinase n=1 Tax=Acidisoma silvae TaxID=2802396 RepID=A0A963YQT9_9PROT|nr:dihydropyrimidinase [Acidisoma silvae]MCB8874838.1 dihydropyrimidinase [Acidisoma silvae]
MGSFDRVVRGGIVVTGSDTVRADIGIIGETIAAIGLDLSTDGADVIDAGGLLVLPGGVDPHCHIEQLEPDGSSYEDSFAHASASCFAGGTTSVITFAAQFKGQRLGPVLAEYHRRAAQGMVDYSFHQIINDPFYAVVQEDIPEVVASGVRSLKVFLTYDDVRIDDRQYLRVLAAARRAGAIVTVHAENYDAIGWLTEALLKAGMTAPKYHAWARPTVIEREATHRAIALAELIDQPIQIFHVSGPEPAHEIAAAQDRGLKVWGETCPQYLVLDAADMDRPGFEGAKFVCSPAPRGQAESEGLWQAIRAGTIDIISSDHSGHSFYKEGIGKQKNGTEAPFTRVPNGVPGLAARMPIIFSEGVSKGRIDLQTFVRLTSVNAAKLFGLYPRKGTIAPGADADLVLWDPTRRVTITNDLMQHAIDYTPYEGLEVIGWPQMTIARGRVVMQDGVVTAEPGSAKFLARGPYELIRPRGVLPNGFDTSAIMI